MMWLESIFVGLAGGVLLNVLIWLFWTPPVEGGFVIGCVGGGLAAYVYNGTIQKLINEQYEIWQKRWEITEKSWKGSPSTDDLPEYESPLTYMRRIEESAWKTVKGFAGMSEKSKKKIKLAVSQDSLGEALHTALRKCCDSDATTLLYNVIELCASGWELYLAHVWITLKIAETKGASFWEALKDASLGFRNRAYQQRRDKCNWSEVVCLGLVFQQLEDDDWKGYASYLAEEDE